jgi:hypothetical protein
MATSTTFMAYGQTHIVFISRTMHCPAPAQELLVEIVRPFRLLEHPTTILVSAKLTNIGMQV